MATGVVKHGRIGDFAVARRLAAAGPTGAPGVLDDEVSAAGSGRVVLIAGDQDGVRSRARACIRAVPVVGDSHRHHQGTVRRQVRLDRGEAAGNVILAGSGLANRTRTAAERVRGIGDHARADQIIHGRVDVAAAEAAGAAGIDQHQFGEVDGQRVEGGDGLSAGDHVLGFQGRHRGVGITGVLDLGLDRRCEAVALATDDDVVPVEVAGLRYAGDEEGPQDRRARQPREQNSADGQLFAIHGHPLRHRNRAATSLWRNRWPAQEKWTARARRNYAPEASGQR